MRVRPNTEICDFADRLARELATIQTGIYGYLSRLEDYAAIDMAGRATFDDTQKALSRSAALVDRLKAMAARPAPKVESVEAGRILVTAAADIKPRLPDGIRLRLHLGRGLRPLRIDTARFGEALGEMIANAAEAMKGKGTVHVEISAVAGQSGETYMRVAVGDTGPGMAPELAGIIGTPLKTTKPYPHKGWGLAVCAAFCRQAGGFLEIDSQPGLGTCAALFLPAA